MRSSASFREAFVVAARSLDSSKLRSFLTLLGVILATTTLIAVMSVVHGMDIYIAEQVSDMGTDGFRVIRVPLLGEFDPKKLMELARRNPRLTGEEYDFLKSRITMAREIGMEARRGVSVRGGNDQLDGVGLQGVTANMALVGNTQTALGRFLTDSEDQKRASVVFIGDDIREKFFPSVDPLGKTIYLQGRPFQVIGVAKKQGSIFGQSRDNFLMIPIETFFKIWGSRGELMFAALALDRSNLEDAQEEVRVLLRVYRHLKPNQEDNFGVIGSDSLVAIWDRLTRVIAAMALGIVSVFMVVGGVVIMNIMLAVVTERTHEIGIRKAVGARKQDILSQFLIESSMLAAAGGLIGVLLAWLAAFAIRNLTPVPMAMPPSAIVVGVGISAIVGLFFGVYPARRAAQLDPIEALRAET